MTTWRPALFHVHDYTTAVHTAATSMTRSTVEVNMERYVRPAILACLLYTSFTACDPMREAIQARREIVAAASGHRLGIDPAAELLVARGPEGVTPDPRAVERVVNLWIDYTLLALELASPDTFSNLDVSSLTRTSVARRASSKLREGVIVPRVDPTDEELRQAYEIEQPFASAEVQQIFLTTVGATESQLDSLARLAESLRQRAAGGEDFGQLVRRYSQDPPTASRSASTGWVSRGAVTPQLDEAIFNLRVGEVSETVRTDFGFYLFKVTARQSPDYGSVRERYGRSYRERRIWNEWTAYVDSLLEAADVRLAPDALDLIRELADAGELERLGPRRLAVVLMRYRDGVLTVGDWVESVTTSTIAPPRFFATMDSASLRSELERLVRERLVLRAADALGYTVSEAEYAGIREDAVRLLSTEARRAGFRREELLGGDEAIASAVQRALEAAGANRPPTFRFTRLSRVLRQGRNIRVYPDRFAAVLEKAAALRRGDEKPTGRH